MVMCRTSYICSCDKCELAEEASEDIDNLRGCKIQRHDTSARSCDAIKMTSFIMIKCRSDSPICFNVGNYDAIFRKHVSSCKHPVRYNLEIIGMMPGRNVRILKPMLSKTSCSKAMILVQDTMTG